MALTERQRQLIAQNAPDSEAYRKANANKGNDSRRKVPVNTGLAQASPSSTAGTTSPAKGEVSTWGQSDVGKQIAALEQRKTELTVGLDLDGAAAVQMEINKLKRENGISFWQRAAKTVSGAVKQSTASWGDSAATMYEAGQKSRDNQNDWYRREYRMQYDDAERDYRFMMEDNAAEPGTWSQSDIDSALNRMAAAKTKLDAMGYVVDNKVQERATEAARDTMYQVAQSGSADVEEAKKGLGAGGRFLVDLGVGATQLATDAAANYLLFGGAKLPNGKLRPNSTLGAKLAMGGRVFGGGTMQARQDGASLGEQVSYGAAMTALEMGLEMLGGLDSVYGKGATSDFAGKLISKLTKSPAGQKALQVLSTAGSEGVEEFLSGVFSPALQSIYDGKSVGSHYSLETLTDAAYEFLVGGALGGAGGAIEVIGVPLTDTQTENAASGVETAVNENGLTALTEQEKTNLSSGKKNKVISTFNEAVGFIKNALSNKQSVDRAYLGKVPDGVAKRVLEETGVDITGYNAILPSDAVRHMFKNHGNETAEMARGQVALTAETAANITTVLSNPDRVYLSDKTDARGLSTLIFEKQIGDYYITAQAVSDGTHSIQTDTLYVQKKKNPQDTVSDASVSTAPEHNARSVPPQGSSTNNTIPHTADSVNSGVAQGFGKNGAKVISEIAQNSGTTIQQAQEKARLAYQTGRSNLPGTLLDLTDADQQRAYNAGRMDYLTENPDTKDLVTGQEEGYTDIKTEVPSDGAEEVHLRGSGQRADSTHPGGAVSAVESRAGGDQSGKAQDGPAASQTAGLTYGEEVSPASQGIAGGSTVANIRLVTGGENVFTRAAKQLAKKFGLRVVFFYGNNLDITQWVTLKDGTRKKVNISARAYISGDRVFIRVDHPLFTADQLMRHEVGHHMIDTGEIDPDTVRERIVEKFGAEKVQQLADMYTQAYADSGLTAEEIWEEVICDSLGDMNIFSETKSEGVAQELLSATKAASADAKAETSRGPPTNEGKMSREADKFLRMFTGEVKTDEFISLSNVEYATIKSNIKSRDTFLSDSAENGLVWAHSANKEYAYLFACNPNYSVTVTDVLDAGRDMAIINRITERMKHYGRSGASIRRSGSVDGRAGDGHRGGNIGSGAHAQAGQGGGIQSVAKQASAGNQRPGGTAGADNSQNGGTDSEAEVTPKASRDLPAVERMRQEYADTSIELQSRNIERAAETYTKLFKQCQEMTPAQIVRLTEQDADTTPELTRPEPSGINADTGKESKLYSSAEKSENVADETWGLLQSVDDIKYYHGISNMDTLNQANEQLAANGQAETLRFATLDPKEATAVDVAEGFILLKRYQDKGDYESAVTVLRKLREIGTTSGQAVQSFSLLGRLTPEGMAVYAQRELDQARKEMVRKKSEEWVDKRKAQFELTPEEVQFIMDTMERAAELPEGRDKNILIARIATMIEDKIPTTILKQIKGFTRNAMLLNTKTMMRNVVGNAIMMPAYVVQDFIAAGVDASIAERTGVRTTGTTLPNKAALRAAKRGVYESFDDFRREVNTRQTSGDRFEVGGGPAFKRYSDGEMQEAGRARRLAMELSNALNKVDRVTGWLLDMGDRPFFEYHFTNSLNNQLRLNQTTQPTAEMIDIATTEALRRTWQDDNAYTKAVTTLRNTLNGGKDWGMGSAITTFVKTPANLTKALLEYSPLGLVGVLKNRAGIYARSKKSKNFDPRTQKAFVDALSKSITGTLVMALGGLLAHVDLISGGDDEEDKDVAAFKQNVMGIAPYSVKIGGKSYTYDWAQPVGGLFAISADFVTNIKNGNEPAVTGLDILGDAGKAIMNALAAGGNVLFEQSFLQGVAELFADDGLVSGLISALSGASGQFMPTALSQIAQLADPYARTSFAYRDIPRTTVNKVIAKIPGLRSTLPAVVDVLGHDVLSYGGSSNVWNVFFNPANVYSETATKAAKEIYRVYEETGDTTIIPRKAPYYLEYKGERYNFTAEERADYQRAMGGTNEQVVGQMLSSQAYQSLNDEDKAAVLHEITNYSAATAKKQFLAGEKIVYEMENWMKEAQGGKSVGLSEGNYIVAYQTIKGIEGLKDRSSGDTITNSKSLQVMEAVYKIPGLTDAQRRYLFECFDVGKTVIHWNKALVQQKLKEMRKKAA